MPFFRDYPYTNFNELNLDYLLAKINAFDSEMKNYVRTVTANSSGIITVIDGNGGTGEIGLIRDSLNSNHAIIAEKDVNSKTITSYVADATNTDNVITLKDGEGNTVKTLTITNVPSNDVITLVPNDYSTGDLLTMNVGDIDYLTSDHTIAGSGGIKNLVMNGIGPTIRLIETEGSDPVFVSDLYYTIAGYTFDTLGYSVDHYVWRSFKIEVDDIHEIDNLHMKITRVL